MGGDEQEGGEKGSDEAEGKNAAEAAGEDETGNELWPVVIAFEAPGAVGARLYGTAACQPLCCSRFRAVGRSRRRRGAAMSLEVPIGAWVELASATLPMWAPPPGLPAAQLFDHFVCDTLPQLRRQPLRVACAGTTAHVAVIIEPRCHPALEHVVRNAAYFLGEGWQVQLFHGVGNEAFTRSLFSCAELSQLQLVCLGVEDLTRKAYSELLCSHWFWSRVAAERVLIFQTDSLICRRGVEEFQKYDYVGAPWRLNHAWTFGVPWLSHAGNGGFSLRSRSVALAMLDSVDFSRGETEDLFFAEHIPRVGGQLAPREVAMRFSVESVFATNPFGIHKPGKYLSAAEVEQLLRSVSYA